MDSRCERLLSKYPPDTLIAGIDEAGRGPLAGPVTAAAVVFRADFRSDHIKDSKKLSYRQRQALYTEITQQAVSWAVVSVGNRRIERLNIRRATIRAMSLALSRVKADIALIDGNTLIETDLEQLAVIKGDTFVPHISAASIVAKVTRDRLMELIHKKYPIYGFNRHFGYPTAMHRDVIRRVGPAKVHRRTYRLLAD